MSRKKKVVFVQDDDEGAAASVDAAAVGVQGVDAFVLAGTALLLQSELS